MAIETNEDEEEYHRSKLLNDHSTSNSDTEQIAIASVSNHETPSESSLPAPPDISHQLDKENEEEQARNILLEQSDISEKSSSDEGASLTRPIIRLKRISQTDAELYMPLAWKNKVSNSQRITSSSSSDENQIKKKSDSNSSKKANEISTTSSTSDDDFRIRVRTRKSLSSNRTEKSLNKSRKQTTNSRKKNDVIINYNPSSILEQSTLDDSMSIADDISLMDEDRILKDVIDNNDNESIFGSLDIAQDKPMEINSNHDMEDLSNDRIQSSPTQLSEDDR